MMDDWNVRRKTRGRIRRAKTRRRRQRVTAAALMLLLAFSVFAVGSVNYGKTRSTEIKIANQHRITYTLPRVVPLLAQVESQSLDTNLPQVLNFNERFPDYRNPPQVDDPNQQSSGSEDAPPPVDAAQNLVILDDLRAAPPKSMFIDAVFESSDDGGGTADTFPPRWLFVDNIEDDGSSLLGHPQEDLAIPPVPEPGTGGLLGLGLIALAIRDRRNAARIAPVTSNALRRE